MQCYVDIATLVLDGERPEADMVVSRSLAAAANYLQTASSVESVSVQFMVRPATTAPEAWERKMKDQFLLCLDRSVTRIYPSLDPAQYLRDPVQFIVGNRGATRYLIATVTLYSAQGMASVSVTLLPLKETRYNVEGVLSESDSLEWETATTASHGSKPAEGEQQGGAGAVGGGVAGGHITEEDDDLWRRARAANAHYVSEAFTTNAVADMNATVERRQRFLWRLSRWCAERFLNESNWARPLESEAQRNSGPKGAHKFNTQRLSKSTTNFLSAYQPTYRSILDAIAASGKQRTKRLGHADGRGMEVDAVLLAATPRYGYVGVPATTSGAASSTTWYLVARVPLPSWCASALATGQPKTKKRSRGDTVDGDDHNSSTVLLNLDEVVPYTSERRQLRVLAVNERAGVTVRSHRVYCKDQGRAEKQPVTAHNTSICFDDSYVTQKYDLHGESGEADATKWVANTFSDVVLLINESCNRFLATRLKFTETVDKALRVVGASKQEKEEKKEKEEAEEPVEAEEQLDAETILPQAQLLKLTESLYNEVTDTFSVHFKKVRDRKALSQIPQVNTVKDLETLTEGCTVEFKYRVDTPDRNELASSSSAAEPQDAVTSSNPSKEAMGRANTERLRHTIAGMASLHGGIIAVGVRDDGKVVGHPSGEVVRALRDSSFCPAMVVHSVSVKELRLAAASMPKEWWQKGKAAPFLRVPTAAAVANDKEGGTEEEEQQSASDNVVTVITIMKGQAPFYASGRTALPYQRGGASTTPMTIHNMIVRLFAVLMERAPALS